MIFCSILIFIRSIFSVHQYTINDYNIAIITILHQNFDSAKPTGHLGSFLEKKAETQIQLERNTINKDWITVKCKRSRNTPFEDFSFKLNEIGLPEIIDLDDVYTF